MYAKKREYLWGFGSVNTKIDVVHGAILGVIVELVYHERAIGKGKNIAGLKKLVAAVLVRDCDKTVVLQHLTYSFLY